MGREHKEHVRGQRRGMNREGGRRFYKRWCGLVP